MYIIKETQKIFFDFLWNNKGDKIKRGIIYKDTNDGGLGMPHLLSFSHALKMCWVKKLLDPLHFAPWKTLLIDKIEDYGGDKIFSLKKEGLFKLSGILNTFWNDILKIWGNVQETNIPTTPKEVVNQPIWYNDFIKIEILT